MSADPAAPLKRVLLVDDEPAVIHITKRMLEMGGYAVAGATSAAQGLRMLEAGAWDLVITDRSMPGMDGEELATQIKRFAPQLPVLLITGYPDLVVHRERFVAVLQKPFASAELLAQVARTLGKIA